MAFPNEIYMYMLSYITGLLFRHDISLVLLEHAIIRM
jgi:hypothetical protein